MVRGWSYQEAINLYCSSNSFDHRSAYLFPPPISVSNFCNKCAQFNQFWLLFISSESDCKQQITWGAEWMRDGGKWWGGFYPPSMHFIRNLPHVHENHKYSDETGQTIARFRLLCTWGWFIKRQWFFFQETLSWVSTIKYLNIHTQWSTINVSHHPQPRLITTTSNVLLFT